MVKNDIVAVIFRNKWNNNIGFNLDLKIKTYHGK
jgi:hypothetical protein